MPLRKSYFVLNLMLKLGQLIGESDVFETKSSYVLKPVGHNVGFPFFLKKEKRLEQSCPLAAFVVLSNILRH